MVIAGHVLGAEVIGVGSGPVAPVDDAPGWVVRREPSPPGQLAADAAELERSLSDAAIRTALDELAIPARWLAAWARRGDAA